MSDYYQYKTTIDDRSEITNNYPDRWNEIIHNATERSKSCKLERRLVVENPSNTFLDGLRDIETGEPPKKAMIFQNLYIGEWYVIACNTPVVGVLIGR